MTTKAAVLVVAALYVGGLLATFGPPAIGHMQALVAATIFGGF